MYAIYRRKGGESPRAYIHALASSGSKEKAKVLAKAMRDIEQNCLSGKSDVKVYLLAHIAYRLDEMQDPRDEQALAEWVKPCYPVKLRSEAISTIGKIKGHLLPLGKKYAQDDLGIIRTEVMKAAAK